MNQIQPQPDMQQFIGIKLVNAKPMTRAEYNAFRGWTVPADENPSDEGMLVEYVDGGKANTEQYKGYVSWSPMDVFLNAYTLNDNITFGLAVEVAKRGAHVARAGWNGKGMWIALIPANGRVIFDETSGTSLPMRDYLAMKTADDQMVPWVASQTDILAEDWMVVQ